MNVLIVSLGNVLGKLNVNVVDKDNKRIPLKVHDCSMCRPGSVFIKAGSFGPPDHDHGSTCWNLKVCPRSRFLSLLKQERSGFACPAYAHLYENVTFSLTF